MLPTLAPMLCPAHAALLQLCHRYVEAVGGQRAQASHVYLTALEKAPDVPLGQRHVVTVIDAHEAMSGWITQE